MNKLKEIHARNLKNGIDFKTLLVELLHIPNIPYAHKLFNTIPNPNAFLYNKLIQAYCSQKQPHQGFSLYSQMRLKNCPPNQHTFTSLFATCVSISSPFHAHMLHAHLVKSGFESEIFALTALVDVYAKLGRLSLARQVFDEASVKDVPTWNSLVAGYSRCGDMEGALKFFRLMPTRNVISWTVIISGYSQNGQYGKALDMFLRMEKEKGLSPNEVTIASVLPACANLGALEIGERIEDYARKNGLLKNLYVSNSLLELYAKSGKIGRAMQVFDEIGKRRNLCTWNSMIMGLAVHGRSKDALLFYDQMLKEGTVPDDVTFVAILLACTHGGLVVKGQELFESMAKNYSISPKLEHYGCMVDLLGRAGKLEEAYALVKRMPMQPDSVIWGALLGACSFHNDVELAEKAAEPLFELEPWNSGNYVILSNIYASAGQWDGVAKLRKLMKGGQIAKTTGYSLIERGGEVHKFIVDDPSHPMRDDICALLIEITTKMKQLGGKKDYQSELEQLCTMQ